MLELSTIAYPPGTFHTDPSLFLLSFKDLSEPSISEYLPAKHLNYLTQTKNWVFDYLIRPNPEIGRSGPVCPFVPKAVQENSIYMTVLNTEILDQSRFYKKILHYLELFTRLTPVATHKSIFRSIIIIIDIPNINLEEIVERAIVDLKPYFVEKKLMLGEFHSGPPNNSGIRNPDFKPLRSPVPLLVIREMVETDIEFLKVNSAYMTHYLSFFPAKKEF